MKTRKPEYRLKYLNKRDSLSGTIGAGWLNEDGSITVVLNSKVVLRQDGEELLTLFPRIKDENEK